MEFSGWTMAAVDADERKTVDETSNSK
jgi:hypothetical protein